MANDLLIAAIRDSGHDLDDIAQIAGVDPRTVQRWLGGRVPHARYRHALATALDVPASELWPETAAITRRSDSDEITGAWRRSDSPDVPDWRALLRSARTHIDLLGYSLPDILGRRGIAQQLAGKVRDGCSVRIAIADPADAHVLAADLAQRPPARLLPRVRAASDRLRDIVHTTGIEGRRHHVATSHTVLRFDDDLLLKIHLHAIPGPGAPLLHLRRRDDYGIFDQLLTHFESVWVDAEPIEPADDRQARARRHAAAAPARDPLDELDYVWRPGP